jgi:hypothetical protein
VGYFLSEPAERVEGVIPVSARLALGLERLNLYITSQRIIVAHIGKRGAGAVAGTTFFGRLSGGFEDLFKSGKESLSRRRLESSSPLEILSADKDNFPILYEDVVRVDVDEAPRVVRFTILSKDEKLEFLTLMGFESVLRLLSERLRGKLVARKFSG